MLAKSLARSLHLSFSRLQFTPDLLPTDVTGRERLQPARERVRVPARAGVRERPPRRRDQPRVAEDAVGAARGDAGVAGDDRRRDVPRSTRRSSSSRRRTRSSTRGRTRSPRRSSTASRRGSRSGTRRSPRRRGCSQSRRRHRRSTSLEAVADRPDVLAAIDAARAVYVEESVGGVRRLDPPAHARQHRDSRSARAHAPASRSCAWPRRARSREVGTTCCPRTCRPSRPPCSRIGSSSRPRLARRA